MDELLIDAANISLPWIYRSAKIVWTKKPIEDIVPSPTMGSEQLQTNRFLKFTMKKFKINSYKVSLLTT